MNGFVYKITSPTGRIYIGSSINPKKRFSDYRCYDCKGQRKLYNSLMKHKYENHFFEIIWEGSVLEMLKQETFYGIKFEVLNQNNLNCRLPKTDDVFSFISEETRKKKSDSMKKLYSEMSEEKKALLGKHKIGTKLSKEEIDHRSKLRRKPIIQMNLNNEFIKKWDSATTASKTLNISQSDISQCCKNKKKSCSNFKWKYLNEELENLKYKPRKNRTENPNKNRKTVIQMDLNEVFIKTWNCINDAYRELNVNGVHITSCCKGRRKTAYGFKWKYK